MPPEKPKKRGAAGATNSENEPHDPSLGLTSIRSGRSHPEDLQFSDDPNKILRDAGVAARKSSIPSESPALTELQPVTTPVTAHQTPAKRLPRSEETETLLSSKDDTPLIHDIKVVDSPTKPAAQSPTVDSESDSSSRSERLHRLEEDQFGMKESLSGMKELLSRIADSLSKLSPTLDEKLERLDCEPANTSTLANVTDEDKLDSALSSSRRERLLRAGFLPPHADHIATDNTKVTFSKGAMLQMALTENMNQRQLIIYPAEMSRPSRSTEQP